MPTPAIAANAYATLARLADPSAALAKAAGESGGGGQNFGAMLKDVLGAVTATGRKSDAQTQAMAVGKSDIVDVVTAVSETEVAVDAVVAVRDRVIAAYEDIMKMPI
jgi:flagellar hook-basal body complex protein FliE